MFSTLAIPVARMWPPIDPDITRPNPPKITRYQEIPNPDHPSSPHPNQQPQQRRQEFRTTQNNSNHQCRPSNSGTTNYLNPASWVRAFPRHYRVPTITTTTTTTTTPQNVISEPLDLSTLKTEIVNVDRTTPLPDYTPQASTQMGTPLRKSRRLRNRTGRAGAGAGSVARSDENTLY